MNRGRFLTTLLTSLLGARFARLLGVEEVKEEVSFHPWPPSPVTDEQIKDVVVDVASWERDLLYGTGSMEPRGLLFADRDGHLLGKSND